MLSREQNPRCGGLDQTRAHEAIGGYEWQSHDFLDAVRDPEIWQKTKQGGGIGRKQPCSNIFSPSPGVSERDRQQAHGARPVGARRSGWSSSSDW
jgi:hypothetical protein